MTWLLDLDGVVWLADQPIPGSAAAVNRLRESGVRVGVATNNSALTVADYLAKLERVGLPTDAGDLVTSAQAAASLLEPGQKVFVCAGPGVVEAVLAAGAQPTDDHVAADVVMVGWTKAFDYDLLTRAMTAVRTGARLIGTNDDATYPTPDGALPGGGSLVAAVAYASGTPAEIAGKPNPPMVNAITSRFGPIDVMVGDRPSTDGRLARHLNARFALVLTGVTTQADLPVDPDPDEIAPDLATLIDAALTQRRL